MSYLETKTPQCKIAKDIGKISFIASKYDEIRKIPLKYVTSSVLPLKQLAKLCHEHHVYVSMHVIQCVD